VYFCPLTFARRRGVVLVYDITSAKSFESLSARWVTQLHDHAASDDLAKLLVGNKSDLEASREVSREKAEQFCAEFGMEMLETSAKSGENVLTAFEKWIGIVHNKALEISSKNKTGINIPVGSDNVDIGKSGSNAVNGGACGC